MVKNCPLLPGELRLLRFPSPPERPHNQVEQPRRSRLEQGYSESQKQSHSDIDPHHGSLLMAAHSSADAAASRTLEHSANIQQRQAIVQR